MLCFQKHLPTARFRAQHSTGPRRDVKAADRVAGREKTLQHSPPPASLSQHGRSAGSGQRGQFPKPVQAQCSSSAFLLLQHSRRGSHEVAERVWGAAGLHSCCTRAGCRDDLAQAGQLSLLVFLEPRYSGHPDISHPQPGDLLSHVKQQETLCSLKPSRGLSWFKPRLNHDKAETWEQLKAPGQAHQKYPGWTG